MQMGAESICKCLQNCLEPCKIICSAIDVAESILDIKDARLEVIRVFLMNILVFWDIALSRLVQLRTFRRPYCLHLHGSTKNIVSVWIALKTEAELNPKGR